MGSTTDKILNDRSIDKKALVFLDSLMQRDDIDVTFLGAADNLRWKGFPPNSQISLAIDQAKKLERALELRKRYGKGEVGITDEPIRGVKVIWSPKPPDVFEINKNIHFLQAKNDSLSNLLRELAQYQKNQLAAIADSLGLILANSNKSHESALVPLFFDWEIKTGLLAWTAGSPYDLSVPSVGISLNRRYWAFEVDGGFTPWSRGHVLGNRSDAMLMGSILLFPRNTLALKAGVFSGWEFLTQTDNWTMKALGVTIGPAFSWKIFEGFAGYSVARLSTLIDSDRWTNGMTFCLKIKFLIN